MVGELGYSHREEEREYKELVHKEQGCRELVHREQGCRGQVRKER